MSTRDHLARGTSGHPARAGVSQQNSGPVTNDGEIPGLMSYRRVMAHLIEGAAR